MKHLLTLLVIAVLTVLVLFAAVGVATAQNPEVEPVKWPARESFREIPFDKWNSSPELPGHHLKLTVQAAGLPRPLLKYRLNTYVSEMESGNAAPLYTAAWAEFQQQHQSAMTTVYQSDEYLQAKNRKKAGTKTDETTDENTAQNRELTTEQLRFKAFPLPPHWSSGFYTAITAEEESLFYQKLSEVFRLVEKAGRKRDCDWSYQYEYQGIATLLEHIHNMRGLARYLSGKANWEIRQGQYNDAIRTLRVGFRMAEHTKHSEFPVLVTTLVGLAIEGIMQNQLRLLVSQEDAPNLYPALTQLIFRQDTFQHSLQAEMMWMFAKNASICLYDQIDTSTDDELKTMFDEIASTFLLAQSYSSSAEDEEKREQREATAKNMKTTVMVMCYPYGRDRLLKRGHTAAEIEAMSPYRLVVPFVVEEIRAAYDQLIVSATFPVGSTHTAIELGENSGLPKDLAGSPVDVLIRLFFPAVEAGQQAFLRAETYVDLMKITEALRYYVFVHGQLPTRLEDVTELHVPLVNRMTNTPFSYRVEGRTAIIDFIVPRGSGASRWEITVETE